MMVWKKYTPIEYWLYWDGPCSIFTCYSSISFTNKLPDVILQKSGAIFTTPVDAPASQASGLQATYPT